MSVRPGNEDRLPEDIEKIRNVKRAVGIEFLDGQDTFNERVSKLLALWQHRRGLMATGIIDDITVVAADEALIQRNTGVSIAEPDPPPWLTNQDSRTFAIRSTEWVRWQTSHRKVVQANNLIQWRTRAGGIGSPDVVAQCFASEAAGFNLRSRNTPHAYVSTVLQLISSATSRGTWHTTSLEVRDGDLVVHSGTLWRVELPHCGGPFVGCLGIIETSTNVFEWVYRPIELSTATGFVRC